MGNEQSTATGPTASPSTFSFLSNRGGPQNKYILSVFSVSVKRNKGIVTVNDGQPKVLTIEEDEIYKRFMVCCEFSFYFNIQEIPKFLPILQNAIGKKGPQHIDSQHKMSSRPIFKYVVNGCNNFLLDFVFACKSI